MAYLPYTVGGEGRLSTWRLQLNPHTESSPRLTSAAQHQHLCWPVLYTRQRVQGDLKWPRLSGPSLRWARERRLWTVILAWFEIISSQHSIKWRIKLQSLYLMLSSTIEFVRAIPSPVTTTFSMVYRTLFQIVHLPAKSVSLEVW